MTATLRRCSIVCTVVWLTVSCAAPAAAPSGAALDRADVRWLQRVTFGVDDATAARLQALGRARFLDEQLNPARDDPPALAQQLAQLTDAQRSALDATRAVREERKRIDALTNDDDKQAARMALNRAGDHVLYEVAKRHVLRAVESPSQLREQMTWFWMNHFNVFAHKGGVRWSLADYEERAVRPHALGTFRELVMATVRSPAMLEYLDNAQSAAGKINENYARELMELHTLGVSGGPSGSHYSQQDVQELARVLTGVGVNPEEPRPNARRRELFVRDGLFEFNPNRHDFGDKTVLGERIAGRGYGEVEQAIALLCRQPATARFVSRKLAVYFVADEPPAGLVDAMVATWMRTDGNLADVLRTMFLSRELDATLARDGADAGKFKDPMQFVVSSLRLAYEGKPITNVRPVLNWLRQLDEPLYGRVTPDGYPLVESAWASPGQMVKRFEIARAIGSGNAGLFNDENDKPGPRTGFPMLNNKFFYQAIEPMLSAPTRDALSKAASQQEWNTALLASPDWMQR